MTYLINPYILSSLPIPNGPQFWIDAGISQSYPGSGNTWFDLSGNNKNFIWSSTPIWNSNSDLSYFTLSNSYKASGPPSNNIGLNDSSGYTFFMVSSTKIDGSANGAFQVYNSAGSDNRGVFVHPGWTNQVMYFDQGSCCSASERTEINQDGYFTKMTLWVFRRSADGLLRDIWRNGTQIIANTTSAAPVGTLTSTPIDVGGTQSYGWRGTLAAFGGYNRALTNEEITQLSNYYISRGISTAADVISTGTVLHLDSFNPLSYPGSGTNWRDLSGIIGDVNVRNRTNDWSFVTESGINKTTLFNNTNRTSGNNPGIDIPMNNGFNKLTGTIEIWIRPGGDHVGGHGWFNNSDGSTWTNNANWLWWGTWDTSNQHYFRAGNASTCCNDLFVASWASTQYPLNTWMQLAIAWNFSSGNAFLYKNGSLIASKTDFPTNITSSNPTNTGQLFNGHTRTDNMQFKGHCGNYRIYNRQLSGTEISNNWSRLRSLYNL